MTESLVVLADFATPEELHVVKSALDAAGIHTAAHDEKTVGSLWHAGIALGGAKLLVKQSDVAHAREIMQEQATIASDAEIPAWTCSNCSENVDSGFAVCWSCGAAHGRTDALPIDAAGNAATDENAVDDDQLPLSREVAKEMLSGYVFVAYSFSAVMLLLMLSFDYRFGAFVLVLAALFFGLRKLMTS